MAWCIETNGMSQAEIDNLIEQDIQAREEEERLAMTPAATAAHIIQRMQNEIGLTSDELGIARRIVAQEIEAMGEAEQERPEFPHGEFDNGLHWQGGE